MRKLLLTCQCGQRMQVPRSAIGKTGMCPTCGKPIAVSGDNTIPQSNPQRGRVFDTKKFWWTGQGPPTEDSKRKFGEAVDLFYSQRHAEALAIFDDLAKQYPGDPNIDNGRAQCLNALRRPPLRLQHQSHELDGAKLDEETVKKVVLEKLLHGTTDTIQLQAAELACKMLGLGVDGQAPPDTPEAKEEAPPGAGPEEEPEEEAIDSKSRLGPPGLYDI